LKTIGPAAFASTALEEINIPESVEEIGEGAFFWCHIAKLEIYPKWEKVLNGNWLAGINSVVLGAEVKSLTFRDDFLVREPGNILVRYFGTDSRPVIQNWVGGFSVGCFYNCRDIEAVVFHSDFSVKGIGSRTFVCSTLKSIRIPDVVEQIDEECFADCRSLSEVNFGSHSLLKIIAVLSHRSKSQ
jgi:hypothetical protein